MSEKHIEKSFLYLLVISIILHLGVIAALYYFPPTSPEPPKEPVFVDLQQMPELSQPFEQRQQETMRRSEQRVRVPRESAPRGDAAQDRQATIKPTSPSAIQPSLPAPLPSGTAQTMPGQPQVVPGSSAASLLKPKEQTVRQPPSAANLFPAASRLAKLEDSYRRKFENDIAEGDTRFLNSDDIVFGSF